MDFESLNNQYLLAVERVDQDPSGSTIDKIIAKAASNFPKDNSESLKWFSEALRIKEKRWFAAKVLAKVHPTPKSLFEHLVLAALVEPNPSSNRLFIEPCINTFGKEQVNKVVASLASFPEVVSNEGVKKVEYWLGKYK